MRGVEAVEVYPAGTLASRKLPYSGYTGAGSKVTVPEDLELAEREGWIWVQGIGR